MKKIVTLMLILSSFASSASTLKEVLDSKECGIKFNKTVLIRDTDPMVSLGKFMLAPLINERNVLLKKGSIHPIVEVDDEVITIHERENIVFMCITDEAEECLKLDQVDASEISTVSKNNLEIICE